MRIATSTIYSQQTTAIDEQSALYAQLGQELSSGKKVTEPSDDPAQIAQDLQLHATISIEGQQSTNVQNATAELTSTDSALSSLTSLLQSARQLAVQGSSDTLSASQRSALADQVDQLLQQAVSVGNTEYNGQYVFGGTASNGKPPVQTQGSPISAVTFTGNEETQAQVVGNAGPVPLSTTFQQAFNYDASDGSPDVFQTLITLRDTLQGSSVTDTSSTAINQPGTVIYGPPSSAASPAATTLNTPGVFATAPVPDSSGNFTITVNGSVNGVQSVQTITVPATAAIDDGVPPPGGTSLVAKINAVSAQTGVTASFDPTTQKVTLTGQGSFYVTDTPSAGATDSGNLTSVLGLATQADAVQSISTQIGSIDTVLDTTLSARSTIGARIQTLGTVSSQLQSDTTDNTNVESGIEDTDVASATTQYTAAQTALEAAYATTTRLESKTLFDYLSTT